MYDRSLGISAKRTLSNSQKLIESIKRQLRRDVRLPHQASAIACDLLVLARQLGQSGNPEVRDLTSEFTDRLRHWGLSDLLVRQVNYAIRIAASEGRLEYEEMHKLFSLCDEIFALECAGLEMDQSLRDKFERSIQLRFDQERSKSKLVAGDRVEPWNKDFWWYKCNL